MNNKLVLASSSPRRKHLLESLGITFDILYPEIQEISMNGESPIEYATRISNRKALSVSKNLSSPSVVLSADTIVVLENNILGKPFDQADAKRMLQQLSGNTHNVITAFTLLSPPDTLICSKHVSTNVTFKDLVTQEIEGYIKTGEPMDKAGAYGIQGIGSFMVEKINGSYTNVIGLPLSEVIQELYKLNFNIF